MSSVSVIRVSRPKQKNPQIFVKIDFDDVRVMPFIEFVKKFFDVTIHHKRKKRSYLTIEYNAEDNKDLVNKELKIAISNYCTPRIIDIYTNLNHYVENGNLPK